MIQTFNIKLTNKIQLTSDVYLFCFDFIEPKEIAFSSGQYLILQIPQSQSSINRIYSIASSNKEKTSFELLIKIIPDGRASEYLKNLVIGAILTCQGPAGMFTFKDNNNFEKKRVFFATGTGFAPMRSMLLSNLNLLDKAEFVLFWGLPNVSEVYLLNELKNLSLKYPKFKFHICLSREQDLNKIKEEDRKYFVLGHVNQGFESCIKNIENCDFYLCGSRVVIDSLKQYLLEKGAKPEEIYFEKY